MINRRNGRGLVLIVSVLLAWTVGLVLAVPYLIFRSWLVGVRSLIYKAWTGRNTIWSLGCKYLRFRVRYKWFFLLVLVLGGVAVLLGVDHLRQLTLAFTAEFVVTHLFELAVVTE